MQELSERISEALVREEARAEKFANYVRIILLMVLTIVALLNVPSVAIEANLLNFGALVIGYAYGFIVFFRIRRFGYHPTMKYITSCLDILMVFLLLFLYTRIEIPSVALKNYVFLVVFPLIGLTAFRYDRKLTLISGGVAIALYLVQIAYLWSSGLITVINAGYERELFTAEITYIGQSTKVLILVGFVLLMSYLASYSRNLFVKLVRDELNMRNQKELTDWELSIASQVQTRFLPRTFPEIAGLDIYGEVQQGKFVGGDYYDFISLDNDKLLAVAADVSGKGVPAALIMAEVRASIHLLASMKIPLEDFVLRLNSLIHGSTDKKSFVTFFAAEVDVPRRTLTYMNTGHPPPLIVSERNVRRTAKGTMPLGASASLPKLTKHTEDFSPGTVLVAYTDGLLEQTNPEGEQFGEERLAEYVRTKTDIDAKSFTQTLFREIKNFGSGRELNDDICVAVVKHLRI